MFDRLPGALIRAILVVMLVIMPALFLPGDSHDNLQIVVLFAILAAIFTIVEYSTVSPSIIEFRDAPPFNRIRFFALFSTVLLLTLVARGAFVPTPASGHLTAVGDMVGHAMDFPFSPVRLMVLLRRQL